MNYLDKLKEKCKVEERFYSIVEGIFEKLLEFGYINKRQEKKLYRKLYENIDTILIGNNKQIDYKTGYYDAVKKELYIRDLNNIESVYLRIIYIITTTQISRDSFAVGYSIASLSKRNYKIEHKNFGINRAIVSNLVCRLLYTIPTALTIYPTYRAYQNDFLGKEITSDNDIYFLEGKLIRQICYCLNISEENLYYNLFNFPTKNLNKILRKTKYENYDEILLKLDEISRTYSNYNKLTYFNKLLNDNYLNIKKNILSENVNELYKEQEKIKSAIYSTLEKYEIDMDDEEDENFNVEASLSEKISDFEELILNDITYIQNILVDFLLENENKYSVIEYVIKLKELEKMLIIKNEKLSTKIYETIVYKLLNSYEKTASNVIEKMKYSIVNEIVSSDKYIKIYKNLSFKRLNGLKLPENTAVVALTVDNSFLQLVTINSLNKQMKKLENNTNSIHLDNLSYLLNNPSIIKDISVVEKIFTSIRTKFNEFNNVTIENMYICNIESNILVVIVENDKFDILKVTIDKSDKINTKIVSTSETYNIFNLKDNTYNSNLPVLYDKRKSLLKSLFSFI